MGRAFVEEVFQGRETMGVRDVGIEGSDINSSHNLSSSKHTNKINLILGSKRIYINTILKSYYWVGIVDI